MRTLTQALKFWLGSRRRRRRRRRLLCRACPRPHMWSPSPPRGRVRRIVTMSESIAAPATGGQQRRPTAQLSFVPLQRCSANAAPCACRRKIRRTNLHLIIPKKIKIRIHFYERMGRPAACPAHRKLAVDFAKLVTRHSSNSRDTIARSGSCSIFELFQIFRPAAVRLGNLGPRNGISEVEFNKALQVSVLRTEFDFKMKRLSEADCVHFLNDELRNIQNLTTRRRSLLSVIQAAGFNRTRNRRAGASSRERDPLGAGLYLFRYPSNSPSKPLHVWISAFD